MNNHKIQECLTLEAKALDKEELYLLGKLGTLPEYKVLDKVIRTTIVMLQNKFFVSAEKLEDFKAIQLMREGLLTITQTVERAKNMNLKMKKDEKHKKWEEETTSDGDSVLKTT